MRTKVERGEAGMISREAQGAEPLLLKLLFILGGLALQKFLH